MIAATKTRLARENTRRTDGDVTADENRFLIPIISPAERLIETIWMWFWCVCVCERDCGDHYEGDSSRPRGSRVLTHVITHTRRRALPWRGPARGFWGVKHPAACFLSACLPTERNRFISVSFNLTHTHTHSLRYSCIDGGWPLYSCVLTSCNPQECRILVRERWEVNLQQQLIKAV